MFEVSDADGCGGGGEKDEASDRYLKRAGSTPSFDNI